ncbi:phosphotransferase [Nonlabens ponticola]|uniref:Aminoglycoside phosphotransferase domain-containing protein n=1 Tax=Nonlabens ponticola TaxID=2496866 RepID=A0A3S9N095_9FLAO|nr:phosphotransferase [Nonlabens ponticola]AZQ44921.1 hypothetical protein EJ995_12055 [Nonlabens ponticola]
MIEISKNFIAQMMSDRLEKKVKILSLEPYAIDNSSSILTSLNQSQQGLSVGHFGYSVDYRINQEPQKQKMVLKVKTFGSETSEMLTGLSQLSSSPLKDVYPAYATLMGFENSHFKELYLYEHVTHAVMPTIYGTHRDEKQGIFMILMEDLYAQQNLNTVMQPEVWTHNDLSSAIIDLASWHGDALHLADRLIDNEWQYDLPSSNFYKKIKPVLSSLLNNSRDLNLITSEQCIVLERYLEKIPQLYAGLDELPKTIIHNDCNLRNCCIKNDSLLLYDWELATMHIPHYDLAEFICFAITADRKGEIETLINRYHEHLNVNYDYPQELPEFVGTLQLAASQFALHRLGLYTMAHKITPYPFLERVYQTYFLLDQFCEDYLTN